MEFTAKSDFNFGIGAATPYPMPQVLGFPVGLKFRISLSFFVLKELKNFEDKLQQMPLYSSHFDQKDNKIWNPLNSMDLTSKSTSGVGIWAFQKPIPKDRNWNVKL